ncbi:MAG: cyclic pyranopterin monophosphate synthase MoaC [Lachnospiraceae bacterium]|nr:cyclic pyranopterin monophosphate synthase MoaC [Lachnospiraceae bacterium]
MKGMVFGIAGFSGSGKTTLIEKLIPILKNDGFSVAAIKHDAHDFDMDREGKDTYRFTAAGADTVMISSQTGSAVLSNSPEDLDDMIMDAYVRGADIVLVEGYKNADIPKIFVLTNRCGYSIPGDIKKCVAIAADDMEKAGNISDLPVFDVNDAAVIADFIKDMLMDERKRLNHFDDEGNARMVDVSDKDITVRTAIAAGRVMVNNTTFDLIKNSGIKKGDVLTVAQIAGIMGAKRTPDLIPMCHPIITDGTDVRLKLNSDECCIDIEAEVKCKGRTGVEMEAICACSVAAMTVYDMCKSVQRDMVITDIKLISKSGGVHGDYRREE